MTFLSANNNKSSSFISLLSVYMCTLAVLGFGCLGKCSLVRSFLTSALYMPAHSFSFFMFAHGCIHYIFYLQSLKDPFLAKLIGACEYKTIRLWLLFSLTAHVMKTKKAGTVLIMLIQPGKS